MEIFFEILTELIFELFGEAIEEKKVPIMVRIISAVAFVILYLVIVGILLYASISSKSTALLVITIFVAVFLLAGLVYKFISVFRNR